MATLIKLFYAAALTTVIILLVSFGVQTFYDGPDAPSFPGQFGRPPTQEEQTRFDEERRVYEDERADYHRNVLILAGLLGLACVVAGVLLNSRLDAIRLGFVAGGVGLILYGIIQGAEDLGEIGAGPVFIIAVIGMAILLGVGYFWLNGKLADDDDVPQEGEQRANYQQAVDYILSFTNWEQQPAEAYAARKFDLRRMRSFLARLGDPQRGRRTVHIAGSKGKGSMAAMVASVLQAAGFDTGLYTSPHLHTFRERIAFNGAPIAEGDFARLTNSIAPAVAAENESGEFGQVTTFEMLTALGFLYFRERAAQWQVLEVGLGGRLDATNVVDDKDVCVIGPIELEHAAILGDTPAKIAAEKAAIIRPGNIVVMGVQPYAEAAAVISRAAREAHADFVNVTRAYDWRLLDWDASGQSFRLTGPSGERELRIPLLGKHQLENAAAAVAAIEALQSKTTVISEEALARGLAATHWPGRLEVVGERPWLILDGAHTPEAALRIRRSLEEYFAFRRAIFVVGASQDKDLDTIAGTLKPIASHVIATQSRHPRAVPPQVVADAFESQNVEVTIVEDAAKAVDTARAMAGSEDLICVLGSLFVAAEAREHLLGLAATV